MRHASTWQAITATQLESLDSARDSKLDTAQRRWHSVNHGMRILWAVELKPWLNAALSINTADRPINTLPGKKSFAD